MVGNSGVGQFRHREIGTEKSASGKFSHLSVSDSPTVSQRKSTFARIVANGGEFMDCGVASSGNLIRFSSQF